MSLFLLPSLITATAPHLAQVRRSWGSRPSKGPWEGSLALGVVTREVTHDVGATSYLLLPFRASPTPYLGWGHTQQQR